MKERKKRRGGGGTDLEDLIRAARALRPKVHVNESVSKSAKIVRVRLVQVCFNPFIAMSLENDQ